MIFHLHEGEERDFRPLKKTSLLQMIEPELTFPPFKSHFSINFFPLLSLLPVGFYPFTLLSSAVIRISIITIIILLMIEPDLLNHLLNCLMIIDDTVVFDRVGCMKSQAIEVNNLSVW